MNDDPHDRTWARPPTNRDRFIEPAASPEPPAVEPPATTPQRTGIETWQTIAAVILFPLPAGFWALIALLVFGVIELPDRTW